MSAIRVIDAVPLRIANWNLDRAKETSRDGIRERMEEVQAQVWVLTESRDSLEPGPDYFRVAESAAHTRGDNDERWVSIWTNISNVTSRPTRDEEFSACAIFKLSPAVSLAVYGMVLPWCGRSWHGHPSANGSAYGAALEGQAQDWSELGAKPLSGLCVAGDFNQDLSDTHFYWSEAARSKLRATLDKCELIATTGDPMDPVRALTEGAEACVDHICLSRALVDRQVGPSRAWLPVARGRKLSDHPGVWIELADSN